MLVLLVPSRGFVRLSRPVDVQVNITSTLDLRPCAGNSEDLSVQTAELAYYAWPMLYRRCSIKFHCAAEAEKDIILLMEGC